jgi:hypothetical protein
MTGRVIVSPVPKPILPKHCDILPMGAAITANCPGVAVIRPGNTVKGAGILAKTTEIYTQVNEKNALKITSPFDN